MTYELVGNRLVNQTYDVHLCNAVETHSTKGMSLSSCTLARKHSQERPHRCFATGALPDLAHRAIRECQLQSQGLQIGTAAEAFAGSHAYLGLI